MHINDWGQSYSSYFLLLPPFLLKILEAFSHTSVIYFRKTFQMNVSICILQISLDELERVNGKRDFRQILSYIMNTVLRNRRFVGSSAKNIIILFVGGKSQRWTSADGETYKERLQAMNTEVVVVTSSKGESEGENGIKELTGTPNSLIPVEIGKETTDEVSDAINKKIVDTNGKLFIYFLFFVIFCKIKIDT